MKRVLALLLCLSACFLCGCGGLYGNYRDVERLLVVEAMGLDALPGGVKLSCATGGKKDSPPVLLSGTGENIEKAAEQIRKRALEEELFCRQTECVIVGEETARNGIGDILSYICRSPDMRMDIPLYIVRGAEASQLLLESGNEKAGISEILLGLQQYLTDRGDSHAFSALEVTRALLQHGAALICAVDFSPSSETEEGKQPMTAKVSGYAVIRDGRLCAFLDDDQAIGAGLLMNESGLCSVTLDDGHGGSAVVQLSAGGCRITPLWTPEGELEGMDIDAKLTAAVTEIHGTGRLDSTAYAQRLTELLEERISSCISSALRLSASLGADFAGLAQAVEQHDCERYRNLSRPFAELLPGLKAQVSVSAAISHANDMTLPGK